MSGERCRALGLQTRGQSRRVGVSTEDNRRAGDERRDQPVQRVGRAVAVQVWRPHTAPHQSGVDTANVVYSQLTAPVTNQSGVDRQAFC